MFSVTKNGKPLPKDKYIWDNKTETFSTNEDDLVLDFSHYDGVTFNTGSNCTFRTGAYCTFNTLSDCNFITGSDCTFTTGSWCYFITEYKCTFKTLDHCNFSTQSYCVFQTSNNCIFNTSHLCTFDTAEECVIIRRDVSEIIIPEPNKKIKLREYCIKGFYTEEELIIKDIIE